MEEMKNRGYKPDEKWYEDSYRGLKLGIEYGWADADIAEDYLKNSKNGYMIYPEHNDEYLQECLDNLKGKGICIDLN